MSLHVHITPDLGDEEEVEEMIEDDEEFWDYLRNIRKMQQQKKLRCT